MKCQAEIGAGFPFERVPLCVPCGIDRLMVRAREIQYATDGELEQLQLGLSRLKFMVGEEQTSRQLTGWNGSEHVKAVKP